MESQEVEEAAKPMGPAALLRTLGKKTRHRSGYDDGATLLGKAVPALEFVMAKDPMPLLAAATALEFGAAEAGGGVPGGETEGVEAEGVEAKGERAGVVAAHPATTSEVLVCDLRACARLATSLDNCTAPWPRSMPYHMFKELLHCSTSASLPCMHAPLQVCSLRACPHLTGCAVVTRRI